MSLRPDIAIIGGSGLYSMFSPDSPEHVETVAVETEFGPPSAPIEIADVGGRLVAFLPRHGTNHQFPAHAIPYRANLAALEMLGVGQVLAPCAVGSLKAELPTGSLVVPDQLVDQTKSRPQTFFDRFEAQTVHAQFADPYCERMRLETLNASRSQDWPAHDGGAMVVIDGPRFSTRAEAVFYGNQDWTLVNMTGHPEAVLARELQTCYCALALVTNYSANLTTGPGVSEEDVYRQFAANIDRLRAVLLETITTLSDPTACTCAGGH